MGVVLSFTVTYTFDNIFNLLLLLSTTLACFGTVKQCFTVGFAVKRLHICGVTLKEKFD